MKNLLAALLLLVGLAYGASAHAWAIYNDSSYDICFDEGGTYYEDCVKETRNEIPPNGTHNGCHNCSAKFVITYKDNNGQCWNSPYAWIPEGGFIRAYNDRIEVWQHCDTCPPSDRLHTYGYQKTKCNSFNPQSKQ